MNPLKDNTKIDLGSVQVHKNVIAQIVAKVISETDGADLIQRNFFDEVSEIFGFKQYPGIDIKIDENGEISVEAKIQVKYGPNMVDIARVVQDAIKEAVDRSFDITIKNINIHIFGIERS